jgi:hypothetical protein
MAPSGSLIGGAPCLVLLTSSCCAIGPLIGFHCPEVVAQSIPMSCTICMYTYSIENLLYYINNMPVCRIQVLPEAVHHVYWSAMSSQAELRSKLGFTCIGCQNSLPCSARLSPGFLFCLAEHAPESGSMFAHLLLLLDIVVLFEV